MSGSDRRRILFINHWAAHLGGAEHSLIDILEETVRRAEVFLVTAEPGELGERAAAMGVTVQTLYCAPELGELRRGGLLASALCRWRGMLSFIGFVLRVRAVVATVNPHLIHANVPKSHVALFLLARLGYRGKACYHVREIFEARSAPYRLYSLLFPSRNACVLAISNAVKDSVPLRMKPLTSVAYNGVRIAAKPSLKQPRPLPALRFVYLGRVVPWKGCDLLLRAFSLVYAKMGARAGTLDIIGDTLYWSESYRADLAAAIGRSPCASACRLLPHTRRPLEDLLQYDVFCIASQQEPFGRVIAEAQGCGLPVIGFASGGIPEVVEPDVTGVLVPYGDVEAFARAMEAFIEKPEQVAAMGNAARDRAARFFNRTTQIKKIVDILEREAGAIGRPERPSRQQPQCR